MYCYTVKCNSGILLHRSRRRLRVLTWQQIIALAVIDLSRIGITIREITELFYIQRLCGRCGADAVITQTAVLLYECRWLSVFTLTCHFRHRCRRDGKLPNDVHCSFTLMLLNRYDAQ